MRTTKRAIGGRSLAEYEILEKKEQIETIENAINFIIGVSGDYSEALEVLEENNLEHRLRDLDDGMPILVGLREIRVELDGELSEMESEMK